MLWSVYKSLPSAYYSAKPQGFPRMTCFAGSSSTKLRSSMRPMVMLSFKSANYAIGSPLRIYTEPGSASLILRIMTVPRSEFIGLTLSYLKIKYQSLENRCFTCFHCNRCICFVWNTPPSVSIRYYSLSFCTLSTAHRIHPLLICLRSVRTAPLYFVRMCYVWHEERKLREQFVSPYQCENVFSATILSWN